MVHLVCVVEPRHEPAVLMEDVPPTPQKRGLQRHRDESLEALGPSSKGILTRLYHLPKLKDSLGGGEPSHCKCPGLVLGRGGSESFKYCGELHLSFHSKRVCPNVSMTWAL